MARSASPLRYPGGKSCLYRLTSTILRLNRLERGHYAEPYAGGSGLALALLFSGHVGEIHLNDLDKGIWAFWHSVLNDTDTLIEKINTTPITIEEWHRQRETCLNRPDCDDLSVGFATFFLNRTNRSGIIKGAGAIGGLLQKGAYKLDCRFNREDLSRRIRRIAKYKTRIHLSRIDASQFMKKIDSQLPDRSLFFIDPPYFNKGSSLYTNYYKPQHHRKLSDTVLRLGRPWLMTYDKVSEIMRLYKSCRQFAFDVNYSAQTKRVGTELLVASKGLKLPAEVRDRELDRPPRRAA